MYGWIAFSVMSQMHWLCSVLNKSCAEVRVASALAAPDEAYSRNLHCTFALTLISPKVSASDTVPDSWTAAAQRCDLLGQGD
jgi:hypothetical protein